MAFTTLTEDEEKELYRLQRYYWQEAIRCEQSKAYLAGCIMLGSTLEALRSLMVNCHDGEAERTGKILKNKKKPKPLLSS